MIQSIKNTINRLFAKIYLFNPITYFPKLIEGITVEFGRVRDFKNDILSATVPNTNMYADSIFDYNNKYGIPNTLPGTDTEKIARIVEKASLSGYPGKEWLENQLQMAGFQLYVFENEPQEVNLRQFGSTTQFGPLTLFGLTSRFTDPSTILGELVVGSTPLGSGKFIEAQFSPDNQFGNFQFGQPDPTALNPQPVPYDFTTNQGTWGYYFTLSPDPAGPVTDENDFLEVTLAEFNYLKNLIIELKLVRNYCILQAKAV